jgi:hypothetical protein
MDHIGGEGTEDGIPLPLVEVIYDVVQVLRGRWAPPLSVELLGGLDKVSGGIHFVRPLNLIKSEDQHGNVMKC